MKEMASLRRAAQKHFAFLSAYGFGAPKETESDNVCAITYSSPAVTITLLFGPPQFEVDLSFGRTSTADPPLHVGDLVLVGGTPKEWKIGPGLTGLEAQVAFLAVAIRAFEAQLCSGDATFYAVLTSARRARVAEWHQAEKLRPLRAQAEAAWGAKDYLKVVGLYKMMQPNLEPTEAKRLSYAEKKLGKISEHGI